MADNKLTPEQVKKALECCKLSNEDGCLSCPLANVSVPECAEILYKESIDLINRQQTAIDVYMQENDRLKTAYIQVSMDRDEIKAENDELKREREVMLEDLQFRTNQVIEQQAEIERLTINMNAFGLGMKREKEKADIIRAEAIKEFAEKVSEQFKVLEYMPKTQRKTLPVVVVKQQVDGILQNGCPHIVNKVLKEMVGEQE